MVRLQVLGRVDLTGPEGSAPGIVLSQPKPLATLIYLAVARPGEFCRRDELLGLLWAETTTTKGRRALSQALHVLRSGLGTHLIEARGADELRLSPGFLASDAVEFRTFVEGGRSSEAMKLYAGDFLPSFYVAEAPGFEDWMSRERADLRALAALTAWSEAEKEEAVGNRVAAIAAASRAVSLSPYDEAAIRRLMSTLDRLGDRAAALRVFNDFATRVERELDAKPSAETVAAAAAIRSLDAPPVLSPDVDRHLPPPPRSIAAATSHAFNAPPSRAGDRRRNTLAAVVGLALIFGVAAVTFRAKSPSSTRAAANASQPGREQILVADFESETADSVLGATVSEAVRLDLSQSPRLSVMSGSEIRSALRLMRRDTVIRLDPSIAREIAQREGAKAILQGEIRRAGGSFVVSARLVRAETGALIGGWRATAADSTRIAGAIDSLTSSLRQGIGESLQSVESGPRLLKLTTSSLPALRKHAMAMNAFYEEDYSRSAALNEEAIALDPEFADAYVSLVGALGRLGAKPARQVEATVLAYKNRGRLGDAERYGVEGNYLSRVADDREAAIDAFKNQARLDPRMAYWGALASLLIQSRRYDEAERTLLEGFRVTATPVMYSHLAHARLAQGKVASALATLDTAETRFPNRSLFQIGRIEVAASEQDYARADSLSHGASTTAVAAFPVRQQALVDAARGRIDEAMSHLRTLRSAERARGSVPASYATFLTLQKLELHGRGDTAAAIEPVERSLSRREFHAIDPRERPYVALAHFFVEAGRPKRAAVLLREAERVVPREFRSERSLEQRTSAMLKVLDGNRAAIDELRTIADREAFPHAALADLAWAYAAVGNADSAASTFKRYSDTPGMRRLEADAFYLARALRASATLMRMRGSVAEANAYEARLSRLRKPAQ